MLAEAEHQAGIGCRAVPMTSSQCVTTDFVMALFDAVLD